MKKTFKNLMLIMSSLALCVILLFGTLPVSAQNCNLTEDGKYEVAISKDIAMGGDNFSDTVTVEKIGDNYYMTFSILNVSSIKSMKLLLGSDKVGETVIRDGNESHYTYTLSKKNLELPLTFRVFINAMKTEKDFNITLDFSDVTKINESIDTETERPARFIPTIETEAGNTELEKGSIYKIIPATAKINNKEISVSTSAYYLKDGEKINVDIANGQIILDNVGEYHVVYRAESDLYKTNLGNNTYSEVDVKIMSKVGAVTIAKIENIEGTSVIPVGAKVQANKLGNENKIYLQAEELMKDFSDNFEVFSVTVYEESGDEIEFSDNIALYLKADSMFDRREIKIYHMDGDGTLEEIQNISGYGRYVRTETNKTGNFIVCVPGVEFVMPMWGYAAITIGALLVLIISIILIVVVVKKKHKKVKQ